MVTSKDSAYRIATVSAARVLRRGTTASGKAARAHIHSVTHYSLVLWTDFWDVCGSMCAVQAGWADIYQADLDCQWIDVTNIALGSYTLELEVNFRRLI